MDKDEPYNELRHHNDFYKLRESKCEVFLESQFSEISVDRKISVDHILEIQFMEEFSFDDLKYMVPYEYLMSTNNCKFSKTNV